MKPTMIPSSGIDHEYDQWVQAGACFIPTNRRLLRVSGADAADFLHRLTSNNIKTLAAGNVQETTVLQGDGRMVGLAQLHRIALDDFLMTCVAQAFDGIFQQLDRMLFREKVTLSDVSEQYSVTSILAAHATRTPNLDSAFAQITALGPLANASINPLHVQVVLPKAESQSEQPPLSHILHEGSLQLFDLIRIEQGWPEFGVDCSTSTIPLEARLNHTIDFAKGCFPGQEIVARIENLGHPAKLLIGLILDGNHSSLVGQAVYREDKQIGHVTSCAWHPQIAKTIALGTLSWKAKDAGTSVTIGVGKADNPLPATVAELPFINRVDQ